MKTTWNLQDALDLCQQVEAIAPKFGCHVALTGGCLYKIGERKDLDLLFYRIRQNPKIDHEGLFAALAEIGIVKVSDFGWVHKAVMGERHIDCFFPEEPDSDQDGGSGRASSIQDRESGRPDPDFS